MAEDYFKIRIAKSVRLAVPLTYIETVVSVEPRSICPIPGVRGDFLGVVNRRGNLTWVLDLSRYLGLGYFPHHPGREVTAVVVANRSYAEGGDGGEPKRYLACAVEELEGAFAATRTKTIAKPMKPKLQKLFAKVAYQGARGIAILEPTALFRDLHGPVPDLTAP